MPLIDDRFSSPSGHGEAIGLAAGEPVIDQVADQSGIFEHHEQCIGGTGHDCRGLRFGRVRIQLAVDATRCSQQAVAPVTVKSRRSRTETVMPSASGSSPASSPSFTPTGYGTNRTLGGRRGCRAPDDDAGHGDVRVGPRLA